MVHGIRRIAVAIASAALLVAACSSSATSPGASPTEPPEWAGNLRAHPVTGAQNNIYIAGTIGSTRGATLTGADTPYGRAELTATSGCIGGGTEPMTSWPIDPHGSISLVLGNGYLTVWKASGLPEAGSSMPVTLHFADAADVIVSAEVQTLEREEGPVAASGRCSG
jgi:copper(I)-binding protein